MLQNKDIHKISEMKPSFTETWLKHDFISSSLKSLKISSIAKELSCCKTKGYGIDLIFTMLISFTFQGISTVNEVCSSHWVYNSPIKKDTFYRFRNKPNQNWRKTLWAFAKRFCTVMEDESISITDRCRCFIIDDTFIAKTGTSIEKVSRVWDHVQHRTLLGFKLLVAGIWDGTSFIPIDFSYHREKGENKSKPYSLSKKEYKAQYKKKREKHTPSVIRSKECDYKKTDMAKTMLKIAVSKGIQIDYVLMDSWFTSLSFIKDIRNIKKQNIHIIGQFKYYRSIFNYNGRQMNTKDICSSLSKWKRCRSLKLQYKTAVVELDGEKYVLHYSRFNNQNKYRVFLSTDCRLSFIKTIKIYQNRWTIEVFFKEAKQLLNLGACQANDFDAHIANTTIVMIQYILMSIRHRVDTYETKWGIFKLIETEMIQSKLNERIWALLYAIFKFISKYLGDIETFENIILDIIKDNEIEKTMLSLMGLYEEDSII